MTNIRTQIKHTIEKRGLKLSQLAEDCDIHVSHLSRFLNGEAELSPEKLRKVAARLGITLTIADGNPFALRRVQIPPLNKLQPDFEGGRVGVVYQAFYDGVALSIPFRFGREVQLEPGMGMQAILAGPADLCRITATDPTSGPLHTVTLQEQQAGVTHWALARLEISPRRIMAGPLLVSHAFWPPESEASQSFVAALLGSALARAYDLLFDSELQSLPQAQIAEFTYAGVANALAQESSAGVFTTLTDGEPRALFVVSPGRYHALRESVSAGSAAAIELANGRFMGLRILLAELPSLADDGDFVAAVVARDRLLYTLSDPEVLLGEEAAAASGEFANLRVTCRGDVKIAVTNEERLSFTLRIASS
ncbi:MAG: helix-turn-helix transcriptional regulator [Thermogutta sp.]